ncbi:MAG: hypothetical protein IAC78_03390 [Firmicutes bacterium]|uniref:Uncharacterized protein n=1 Tax=Candidatus Scatoplasma merdavium TaxID=2840932 RepID=A0A9D9D9W2_9BACL|nr:hypothetical protein [Candidatus Scatoplasma merdavium]
MKTKTDAIKIIVGVLIAVTFVVTVIIGCAEQVLLLNLPTMIFCFLLFLYSRLDNDKNDKSKVETTEIKKDVDENIDDVLKNIGMHPDDKE